VLIHKRYGFATVFLGGKEDLEYIHKAVKILQHPYCITAGITNITQSAAILRRAKLFIGNDSGPAHLASAVNVPVIVLFSGVNLSEMWRPWGKNVFVIQNKPSCYLCGLKECNQPKHICMDNITVEDVIEKAQLVIG
jgi:ADP-heptose:LPS heptosyltransferase